MSRNMDFTQSVAELDRESDLAARKAFQEGQRNTAVGAARLMVSAFWKTYQIENARAKGVPGLFRAVNAGMFYFLTYAKHWELERNRKRGV